MIVQQPEPTERAIHQMTREQLIETLLGYTNYFSVRLTATGLAQHSTVELRRLLIEVNEHFRGKSD